MYRRYQEEFGVASDRLALTGAMSDDELFAVKQMARPRKERLYRELGLAAGQPLVLLAFPPNQFSANRPGVEFADYPDMTRFLIASLGALNNCNVVVSLHPRTGPETKKLIESLGGKVSTGDTLELVPLCDVYVACVSATIRWAITCGVPVINYDIFHYCYDDYDSALGVLTIQSKDQWLSTLEDLWRRPDWIADWAKRQAASAARVGHVRRLLRTTPGGFVRPVGATSRSRRRRAYFISGSRLSWHLLRPATYTNPMLNLLLTGGCGFIGSNLIRYLLEAEPA